MDDSKVTHKEKSENLIAHFGSIDVKKMKAEADFSDRKYKFEDLIDSGSIPQVYQGNLNVGFFNANTFAKGIANLGYQCIADYLIRRDINVHLDLTRFSGQLISFRERSPKWEEKDHIQQHFVSKWSRWSDRVVVPTI